jgi:hypothetical protein
VKREKEEVAKRNEENFLSLLVSEKIVKARRVVVFVGSQLFQNEG